MIEIVKTWATVSERHGKKDRGNVREGERVERDRVSSGLFLKGTQQPGVG